ncbi:uncharacterized protein C11orf87-like [Dunckerocampus dactyliophorus]|uniref:uncharacterized protein C11orf87-like n=1 Tax=Dunckerocampus dactyliophorus TaxID=161453 RepID=UPI0024050230|nr:uncharacterized protein C11orf87-like [Dunckerocampus dactyliophorus]
MTPSSSEAPGPSAPAPRCLGLLRAPANNGTCAEQLSVFPPLSSTLALLVLVAVLAGIVLVSVATFHFNKRRLRNRKIQRAQEEFERDSRSPVRAAGAVPVRPCVITRPVRCPAEEEEELEREQDVGEEDSGGERGNDGASADC